MSATEVAVVALLVVVAVLVVALGAVAGVAARRGADVETYRARAEQVEVAWRELWREVLALRAERSAGPSSLVQGWGCSCGAHGELRADVTPEQREAFVAFREDHDDVCEGSGVGDSLRELLDFPRELPDSGREQGDRVRVCEDHLVERSIVTDEHPRGPVEVVDLDIGPDCTDAVVVLPGSGQRVLGSGEVGVHLGEQRSDVVVHGANVAEPRTSGGQR